MRCDPSVRLAYGALVAIVVASAVGFRAAVGLLNIYLRKESVSLREPLDSIPTTLGKWRRQGADMRLGGAMIESLGTNQYLDRQYAYEVDASKGVLLLHIAYYTGMVDAVPHVPERCWGAAGMSMVKQPAIVRIPLDRSAWDLVGGSVSPISHERYPLASVLDPVTRRESKVSMPLGETDASVTVFQDSQSPDRRVVGGYFFVANARLASTPYIVRSYAFDLSNRYAYYCKVQFSLSVPKGDKDVELWTERTSDLLGHLFPYLMRCLPDWPSLESAETKES